MASVINTNLLSLNAQRNTASSQSALATSMQRLSSGLRVNSAKDDAAGLAISERLNAQVRGSNVAIRNANDGISLSQTAEGALSKVNDSLQRMRELAVQARNATNTSADKDSLDKEFGELSKEIQRVLGGTTFNGRSILATDSGTQTFQVGANTTSNDRIDVVTSNMTTDTTITAVAHRQHRHRLDDRHRHRQHRHGHQHGQLAARHAGCRPEPHGPGDLQPADLGGEPERCEESNHRCRLRAGNRQHVTSEHPAAGGQRDDRPGQPGAVASPLLASMKPGQHRWP